MKVVIAQLFLIVCSLCVVLALGALYWPIGTSKAALQQQMSDRLRVEGQARDLDSVQYKIPGMDPAAKGPVTPKVINAKTDILNNAKTQAERIDTMVSADNEVGRVTHGVPLLGKVKQGGYLPKIARDADSMYFKDAYEALFKKWLGALVLGTEDVPANVDVFTIGSPPVTTDLDLLIRQAEEHKVAMAPKTGAGVPIVPTAATFTRRERDDFIRNMVSERAKKIAMYANRQAFQIRPWAYGDKAPSESEIFEAFVDSWIQQDVVDAIQAVNSGSKSVETSPIKQLELIAIGSMTEKLEPTASGGASQVVSVSAGSLFVMQNGAGPMGMGAGGTADFSKSMTGRACTGRPESPFDVTHFKVIVDLDPSYLNRFIRSLYVRNNGYTVVSIPRIDSVDPFDAASRGYLYGKVPVVRVEMLVEALFFRKWTEPLMPDNYRSILGVPARPAAGGGPGGAMGIR